MGKRIERVQCKNQLHRIGRAIGSYQSGHGGQSPPSLTALVESEGIPPGMLTCPGAQEGMGSDWYIYRGADLSAGAAGDMILVYDGWGNHDDGYRNVLLADGSVRWVDEEALEALVAWDNGEREALGLPVKPLRDVAEAVEEDTDGWIEELPLEPEEMEEEPGVML